MESTWNRWRGVDQRKWSKVFRVGYSRTKEVTLCEVGRRLEPENVWGEESCEKTEKCIKSGGVTIVKEFLRRDGWVVLSTSSRRRPGRFRGENETRDGLQ